MALVLLVGITVAAGAVLRLDQWRDVLVVVARAIVQILLVAVVVKFVFTNPQFAPVYLAVMVTAATATSARRLARRDVQRAVWPVLLAIVAGAGLAAAAVILSRAIPWDVSQLLPLIAQLIGGAMTATTLASLRMVDDVAGHWDEVEAWLCLGARPDEAVRSFARGSAASVGSQDSCTWPLSAPCLWPGAGGCGPWRVLSLKNYQLRRLAGPKTKPRA